MCLNIFVILKLYTKILYVFMSLEVKITNRHTLLKLKDILNYFKTVKKSFKNEKRLDYLV